MHNTETLAMYVLEVKLWILIRLTESGEQVPCEFQEFKHVLMEMRKVDDKVPLPSSMSTGDAHSSSQISYALNLTDVVREDERLSCGKIWDGIWTIHAVRSCLR